MLSDVLTKKKIDKSEFNFLSLILAGSFMSSKVGESWTAKEKVRFYWAVLE